MQRRTFLRRAAAGTLAAGPLGPFAAAPVSAAGTVAQGVVDGPIRLFAAEARVPLVGMPYPHTSLWTFGGSSPGPTLRLRRGEAASIRVDNALEVPTSVHWHGVRVPWAMDGVAGLTQPPIAPGEGFDYAFAPPDAGTYWYHAHANVPEQVGRGLYGALIVEEDDPIAVDRELVWVLDDWRLAPDATIVDDFGHRHDLSHAGRIGNTVTVNGRRDWPHRVRAGERVRLRLVNAANARLFALDASAPLRDGPPGTAIDLGAATVPEPELGEAIEHEVVMRGGAMRGLDAATLEDERLDGRELARRGKFWALGDVASTGYDVAPMLEVASGRTVRVRFVNETAFVHPMHLHGHHVRLLSVDGRAVERAEYRDSVPVAPDSRVEVAFVAGEPGRWLLHCHVLEHHAAGMGAIVAVTA